MLLFKNSKAISIFFLHEYTEKNVKKKKSKRQFHKLDIMESRRVRVCLHPRELLWLQRPDHQMNAICQTGRAPTKKHHPIVFKKKKKKHLPTTL